MIAKLDLSLLHVFENRTFRTHASTAFQSNAVKLTPESIIHMTIFQHLQ